VGVVMGVLLPAIWNVLRLTLEIYPGSFHKDLNAVPMLFFPLMTGYALVRHNALAVDRFTAAVVGYGLTIAMVGISFGAMLIGIPYVVGRADFLESPVGGAALATVAFFVFTPLYRRVKEQIDRLFFRENASSVRTLEALRDLAITVQTGDRDEAFHGALEATMILQPDHTELWIIEDDPHIYVRVCQVGEASITRATTPRGALRPALLQNKLGGGLEGLTPNPFSVEAQDQLADLELVAATPVRAHGVVVGFLGVARKRSGLAYTDDDLSFLSAVATEAAHAIERAHGEGSRFGRYRIEKRLGTGGMAEVFLAWQLGLGGFERKVALKRPLPHLADDPDCVAMLLDEARISSSLTHPNIVQIYEVDRHEGLYYIAMEYIDGPSLRALMRSSKSTGRRMPQPVILAIISNVLSALAYAHSQKDAQGRHVCIVHRDVTPGNVLLTAGGAVKLADFGIARAATRLQATRTGHVKGTLPYMAPEQAKGHALDNRTDLYAVGVLLFELIFGKRAFPMGPLHAKPVALRERVASLRPALGRVIGRALSQKPDSRFRNADAMREALLEALPVSPARDDEVAAWANGLQGAQEKAGDGMTATVPMKK